MVAMPFLPGAYGNCSSIMFFIHNSPAAILLLVLTQNLVFASRYENDKNNGKIMAEMIVRIVKIPWINRIHLVILPSNSSCAIELAALIAAIKSEEMWALRMLDASSKIPSGILRGNVRDLGMYEECIGASGGYNDSKIRGKHCAVSIGTVAREAKTILDGATNSFSSSLCVPSSCNETHINDAVNAVLKNASVDSRSEILVSETSCLRIGSEDFTVKEILIITLFVTFGAFLIFCTTCDFVQRIRPGYITLTVNELAKFSLYTNAIALLSTKKHPQTMPAIQGIRFLSMCWIVLGHRYFTSLLRPITNLVEVREWFNSWTAVYIQTASFAVDSFFVISGFLVTYLFLKSKQSGKKGNFPMMYLHRYLRLTPCLAVVVLFVVFFLRRISNGLGQEVLLSALIKSCEKNWWANLLYVHNFVEENQMCLMHSWYLAVDMQLFWISPIILYPLYRWPKYGLGILYLFIFASIITPAVVLAVNGYSNALTRPDFSKEQISRGFQKYSIPTYNRACPYFIGILLGYEVTNKKRNFSKVNVVVNWTAACSLMLLCGWATHYIYNSDSGYNLLSESIFAGSSHLSWSIAIAWIIYACTQGYGGFVTRFLSLPLFLPLSRLSYCIYLVHLVIQMMKNLTARNAVVFGNFEYFNDFCGDLLLSILVAFILSLFFEYPVIVLEKMITNRGTRREEMKRKILVRMIKRDVEMGVKNYAMAQD